MLAYTCSLLLLPAVIAYLKGIDDLMYASVLCYLTSVVNHSSGWRWARYIDIIVVNTIALFYSLHSLVLAKTDRRFILVPMIGLTALVTYLDETYDHALVHLISSLGMVTYALLR